MACASLDPAVEQAPWRRGPQTGPSSRRWRPSGRGQSDLALARAAAAGHPDATERLERLVRATRPFVARIHGAPAFLDDLHQLVMGRLLLGSRPRVLDYAGLGPLGAWLRALAVRLALDERRRVSKEQPSDDVSVFLAAHVTRAEPTAPSPRSACPPPFVGRSKHCRRETGRCSGCTTSKG